jgi:hypothetical protein
VQSDVTILPRDQDPGGWNSGSFVVKFSPANLNTEIPDASRCRCSKDLLVDCPRILAVVIKRWSLVLFEIFNALIVVSVSAVRILETLSCLGKE